MKRYLLILFLLGLSMTGLADSAIHLHNFDPSISDPSVNFLGQIFGSVGSTLHGSSGQMLGSVFKVLNEAFVVIAGLWLFYTVLTVVLRSATEGSFLGQNKNTLFIFVRVAFGIGLLLPLPGSGYSAFQEVVIFVVEQGVGLANQAWDAALDYLDMGGSIYTTAGSFNKANNSDNIQSIQKVAGAMACMSYHYQSLIDEQNNNNSINGAFVSSTTIQPIYPNVTDTGIYFPSTPSNNTDTGCGHIQFDGDASSAGSAEFQKAAIVQVMNDVQSASDQWGKLMADRDHGKPYSDSQASMVDSGMVAGLVNASIDYNNLILPLLKEKNNQLTSAQNAFISDAKKDGWMFAGRYYWNMINTVGQAYSNYSSVAIPMDKQPQDIALDTNNKLQFTALPQLQNSNGDYASSVQSQLHQYDATSQTGGGFYDEYGESAIAGNLFGTAGRIIGGMFGGLFGLISDMMMISQNPILWLHQIGVDCIRVFLDIWVMGAITVFGIELPAYVCSAVNPAGPAIDAVTSWLKPILFGMTSMLLIAGILLGYYLPLYPFFVFMFGVVGWIIGVIEAMVAAPMVALGLTHPDGHDFLGKAEQAVMLLLGIFLRPVLMVIGLVAAMILMFVVLKILNAGFVGILFDTTTSFLTSTLTGSVVSAVHGVGATGASGATVGPMALWAALSQGGVILATSFNPAEAAVAALIFIPIFLLIYGLTLYQLVSYVFSLIHVLPDRVGRWIGLPHEQSETPQMLSQIKGNIGQYAGGALNMHQMDRSVNDAKQAYEAGNANTVSTGGNKTGNAVKKSLGLLGRNAKVSGSANQDGGNSGE